MTRLADTVRRIARERELSLNEVARRGDIEDRRLDAILLTANPGIFTIQKVAKGLGMTLTEFISAYENPPVVLSNIPLRADGKPDRRYLQRGKSKPKQRSQRYKDIQFALTRTKAGKKVFIQGNNPDSDRNWILKIAKAHDMIVKTRALSMGVEVTVVENLSGAI